MKYLIFSLTAILTVLISSCSEDPIDSKSYLTPEQKTELRERRNHLKSLQKSEYSFQAFSSTREEAIGDLLEVIRQDQTNAMDRYLITKTEYETMLWPNFPEEQTLSLGNTFENYWAYQETRRTIGVTDLSRLLKGLKKDDYTVEELKWDPEVRRYGVFSGHILKSITLKIKNKTIENKSIRFVAEYKGKFKVAGLSR
jgi:hypothetical protein